MTAVEDRRPCPFCAEDIKVAATVCRFCGRDLPAPGATPATRRSRADAGVRPVKCPVCDQFDQVFKVSAILSEGTSSTTGSARTTGSGVGTGAGVFAFSANTKIDAQTATHLVQQFTPSVSPVPKAGIGVVVFILMYLAVAALTDPLLASDRAVIIIALSMSIAATALAVRALNQRAKVRDLQLGGGRLLLRESYYCRRDDVAFDPGNRLRPMPPTHFTHAAFTALAPTSREP